MPKQNQGDRPDKNSNPQDNSTSRLIARTEEAFKRLEATEKNTFEFFLQFEAERKRLGITQTTFNKAWEAWLTKRRGG